MFQMAKERRLRGSCWGKDVPNPSWPVMGKRESDSERTYWPQVLDPDMEGGQSDAKDALLEKACPSGTTIATHFVKVESLVEAEAKNKEEPLPCYVFDMFVCATNFGCSQLQEETMSDSAAGKAGAVSPLPALTKQIPPPPSKRAAEPGTPVNKKAKTAPKTKTPSRAK